MTLAGRTSAFFLGVLALVLVGFTAALYALARSEFRRQVDERLEAALTALAAAVEVKPDGLEWEAKDRRLTLGTEAGEEPVRWVVRDGRGRLVGRSENLAGPGGDAVALALAAVAPRTPADVVAGGFVDEDQRDWRTRSLRIQAERAPAGGGRPSRRANGDEVYATLVLTAGLSLRPAAQTLGALLLWSAGLSAASWLLAALMGLRLCRRALTPLTRMAGAARAMTATDLHQRLPGPGTRDELEDLAAAFNDLLTRVEDAFARQARFTGEASHQLRTPLTALLGQVEVTLRRERSPDEYRQTLARAQRQGQQLAQIVETLLFLARADAEAGLPELEVIDLAAWLPTYLANWSGHPRAADMVLARPPDVPLRARTHPALLGQLLDNLLDNACKYSPADSPVTVRAGQDGGRVWVEVQDCGPGMNDADLAHLFEPFFRSPHARRQGLAGVGLGLAVVRRIATALGGSVRVRSTPGAGSVFTVELPAGASVAERREQPVLV